MLGQHSMQKRLINMKKGFSKVAFALLFLSVLTMVVVMTPAAKAQDQSITLLPTEGPAGTAVQISVYGFTAPYKVTVTFDTTTIATITPFLEYNSGGALFHVPAVTPGSYTVTATGSSQGQSAQTTFTVTEAPAETEAPTAAPTGTSGGTSTYSPTGAPVGYPTSPPAAVSSGFWSPLTIGVIVVVVAFAFFGAFMYMRRGRQEPLSIREKSRYEPRPSTPPSPPSGTPYTASRTNQPPTASSYQSYSRFNQPAAPSSSQPYSSSRFNQPAAPSSYQPYSSSRTNQPATARPQTPYTTVCRHCKRTVRDDLSICPYCSKKIR